MNTSNKPNYMVAAMVVKMHSNLEDYIKRRQWAKLAALMHRDLNELPYKIPLSLSGDIPR